MSDSQRQSQSVCNLNAALVRLGGDEDLLREMIQFYLEDYKTLVRQIKAAAEAGDPNELARRSHSLKGLAANFDGQEVIEAANTLTRAARGLQHTSWPREVDRVATAAERLAAQLCDADELLGGRGAEPME